MVLTVKVTVRLVRGAGGCIGAFVVNEGGALGKRLYASTNVFAVHVAQQKVAKRFDPAKVQIVWEGP